LKIEKTVVSSHGKLLLFGEHAVVWGHPAVGLSLDRTLKLSWTPQEFWSFSTIPEEFQPAVKNLVEHFQKIRTDAGLSQLQPGDLAITSEVPIGSGFGSSGALCAALAQLFFPAPSLSGKFTWDALDALARSAESLFHGHPSGFDTALALRQGWWKFQRQNDVVSLTALDFKRPNLVIGAIPRLSSTKNLVEGLAERRIKETKGVSSTLASLGEIANQGALLFQKDTENFDLELGRLFTMAQKALSSLGLSVEAFETLFEKARTRTGALGAKLSGAGGGGAFVLVYPSPESASQACHYFELNYPSSTWTLPPSPVFGLRSHP
jgi:mevalonate kinase